MATAREESGAGSVFGHKVSAYLMARLASRQSYASFCNAPIVGLTLQGSWMKVPFDDQVVIVDDGLKQRRHLLQCKLKLVVRPSDPTFQDVLSRVYAALVAKVDVKDDDLFVVVCDECTKSSELGKLFQFASGSTSLQELRDKLASEGGEVLKLIDTIFDTLNRCIGSDRLPSGIQLDEVIVHSLLRRMRVWKCDLSNPGSNDQRHAEGGLLPFCSSKLTIAQDLYRRYESAASGDEARRATFTWSSLREIYGALEEPCSPDLFERGLSAESVAQFEGEVDLIIHATTTRTFESHLALVELLQSRSVQLTQALSSSTAEAAQFIQVCGKAARVVAMSLLKMSASHKKLREWLPKCQDLAPLCHVLWTPIARLAIELGDSPLLEDARQRITDSSEYRYVVGLCLMSEGKQREAKAEFEHVSGSFRADALINLASIEAELDPSEAGHQKALVHIDEAVRLKPDSIVLKLIRANHQQAQYLPYVSSIYLPNSDRRLEVQNDLSEAMSTLNSVAENIALGSFERLLTARIRMQLLSLLPTVPALIPSSADEVLSLVSLQGPEPRRMAATLLANVGEHEIAIQILRDIEADGDSDDDPAETARLLKNLCGEGDEATVLPVIDNGSLVGMSMIRQGLLGTVGVEPSVADALLREALASRIDCSFIPEMRLAAHLSGGNVKSAREDLDDLVQRFPFAVGTWSSLLSWLDIRCNKLRPEEGSADVPVGTLALALQVARILCDMLPFDSHYAKWIQFAACESGSKTQELDLIGEHAEASGNRWAASLARAIACEDRKDFRRAATFFDAAFEEGGLSPDMRVLHDQCRWFAHRFDDLASAMDDLLEDKRRHPGQAQPTISALRELGRDAHAWELAQKNLDDFPDSEIALWIAFHTAKALDLEQEWGSLLQLYTRKFPESERVWQVEIGESADAVLSIMNDQRDSFEDWQLRYVRCEMPLRLLPPGKWAFNYERQSSILVGLQTTRTGFGIRVATAEGLRGELILDATAMLTLSKFMFWDVAIAFGAKLVVPDFVDREVRAEARRLEIEQDRKLEVRFDRVKTLLRHSTIRTCQQLTDPIGQPIVGLTYLEADRRLIEEHGLVSVGDRDEVGVSLGSVLELALSSGLMSRSEYMKLPEVLRQGACESDLVEFPSKVLIDDRCVDVLSQLSNAADILSLFKEVWVGPSALFGLSLQLGQVELERSSRELMLRLVRDLDKHIGSGALEIKSTTFGKLGDIEYFEALCALAAETGWAVWIDDMASRRLLTGHAPPCCSISTLEILTYVADQCLVDKMEVELRVLELVAGGHRDAFWPDLVTRRSDLPVSQAYAGEYIHRLSWQVREWHLNLEERELYLKLLRQNLVAALQGSVDLFLTHLETVLRVLDSDASDVLESMLAVLQLDDRAEAVNVGIQVAHLGQRLGRFSLRAWSFKMAREFAKVEGVHLNFVTVDEDVEFRFWFQTFGRVLKRARSRLKSQEPVGWPSGSVPE